MISLYLDTLLLLILDIKPIIIGCHPLLELVTWIGPVRTPIMIYLQLYSAINPLKPNPNFSFYKKANMQNFKVTMTARQSAILRKILSGSLKPNYMTYLHLSSKTKKPY